MLVSFAGYILTVLAIGLVAYRRSSFGNEDYLVSNRERGTWVSALSASAASESGWVMLGLVGAAYKSGISCFWLLPGCLAGYLFNWLVLGPRLQLFSREHQSCSILDVLDARFAAASSAMRLAIRLTGVVLILMFLGTYVSAQFVATGKAIEVMTGGDYRIGVLFGMLFVVTYTALGGKRAVSWVDTLKSVLMIFTLVAIPLLVIYRCHSDHGRIVESLRSIDPSLLDWRGTSAGVGVAGFVIGWVGIGLGYPGQPHVLKSFLSARDQVVFRGGRWISLIWSQTVFAGAIMLGLGARILFPDLADPEHALPHTAVTLLPGFLAGIVMAAIFSAICSTADAQLLEVSSAAAYDGILYLRNRSPDQRGTPLSPKAQTLAGRVSVIVLGLMAGLFALSRDHVIFTMVLYSWGALGASFGTVLTLSLFWPRTTAAGALSGLFVGPLVVVLWRSILGWNAFVYELVPAFLLSLAATICVSLIYPQPSELTAKTQDNVIDGPP